MAKIWYGHFDSTPDDQRELLAEDWAGYISMFLSNGVRNGGTNLQITADNGGMYTLMDEGYANLNGYFFRSVEDIANGRYFKIAHPAAHPTLPRIDRVILRLDTSIAVRQILPTVKTGIADINPIPPELTREDGVYEISLARVYVQPGAAAVKNTDITDERLDSSVCGIVNSLITADTEGLFQDFTDKFWERMGYYEASFEGQIDEQAEQFSVQHTGQKDEFDQWFGSARTNIAMLQTYDFDNLADLAQVDKITEFLADGSIEEKIVKKYDSSKIAERKTVFNEDGTISVTTVVYEEDGESVKRESTVHTSFEENGNIKEEVV